MKIKQNKILDIFAEQVRRFFPKAKIIGFGSYVRGEATADSDLDVCIILPSMHPDDRLVVSDIAWEVGFAHDLHLSTIVISEEKFSHGPISASPLLDTIRNEGVAA
jgi:predicted nucleotidyltransferase